MTAFQMNNLIDPSLSAAIEHWKEYSDQTTQNSLLMIHAITPLKDAFQVAGEVYDAMQQTDWQQTSAKLTDPSAMATAMHELTDIQLAALDRLQDSYKAFLKTTQTSGEQLANVTQNAASPQSLLSAYLETGLDILKQYQADVSDEAASLNTIQAAYKAWGQKNFQTVLQPEAVDTAA